MFLLLKGVVLVSISLLTGALVSLGILPATVVAPDVSPPTPVVQTTEEPAQATTTPQEVLDEEFEREPNTGNDPVAQTEPKNTSPLIDDFEKSLQEALDALAALENKKNTQQNNGTVSALALNEIVRSAVVNILCTSESAGPLNSISGSGVIIHPSGVVLTNAHVAQYFLLEDYPTIGSIDCIIRTGSPALPAYKAELLFLSPSWIAQNAHKIDDEKPTGNGEHDYALLLITELIAAPGVTAPKQFSYLPLVTDEPKQNTPVLLAGYPAGFLGGVTIQTNLYKTSAEARVEEIYTFNALTVDLFSIGGSVVAQSGSSGGAVAQTNTTSNNGAALLGVIVTSSDAPDTASRDLRALSTSYIIRDFEKERGTSLQSVLNSNLQNELINFRATTFPTLAAALISVLEN